MPEAKKLSSTERAMVGYQEGGKQGAAFGQYGSAYGAAGGAIDGYFNGPIFKAHMQRLANLYTFPQLDKLKLNDATAGMDEWLKQVPYADRLQAVLDRLNSQGNASYRRNLLEVDPSAVENAAQEGRNVNSQLRGELPDSVKQQIMRQAAFKSLQGGFGGSGMSRALEARDLGLGALDLIGRGQTGLQAQAAYDHFLTPYNSNALDMFTSAPDLLQRDDRTTAYNNQIANQQKALDFASNIAISGGDTSAITSMAGGFGGGRGGGGYGQPQQGQQEGGQDWGKIIGQLASWYQNRGSRQQGNPQGYTTDTGVYYPSTTVSYG